MSTSKRKKKRKAEERRKLNRKAKIAKRGGYEEYPLHKIKCLKKDVERYRILVMFFVTFLGVIACVSDIEFNPFRAQLTDVVVENKEYHHSSKARGLFTNGYHHYDRYECNMVGQEEAVGFKIDKSGKWEIGEKFKILWYDGINPEQELISLGDTRFIFYFMMLLLISVFLWVYYEIKYRVALNEEIKLDEEKRKGQNYG